MPITGVIKLADFGLAKTLEYGASLAESFCGTLDFIAPERMTGEIL
jgi:serine/threonine protein kinase